MSKLCAFLSILAALAAGACAAPMARDLDQDRPYDDDEVDSSREALYPKATALWPQNKAIDVCWQDPNPADAQARAWVQDAISRSWEAVSNVRFTGWGTCAATSYGVRIRVADEASAPHTVGLGTALYGVAGGVSLNFTFLNWSIICSTATEREGCIRSIAVHEFGHVLGFAHEQNRPDTNRSTCTDAPQGGNGDTLFGTWDLSSVMDYCNPNWNNNGMLSATDIAGAQALYGTRKISDFGLQRGSWHADKHVRLTADVNDDGRDDIVGFGDAGTYVSLARATGGFDAPSLFYADFGYDQGWRVDRHVRLLGDVNGDGRADIVAFGQDGTWVALSGSVRFYAPTFLGDFGYNQGWRVERHVRTLADVNGDGKADIVGFGEDGVWIALSLGDRFDAPRFVVADFGYNQGWRVNLHSRHVADLNDDGKADVVGFGIYGVSAALSNGAGFGAPSLFTSEFGTSSGLRLDQHPRFLSDINLDGRADIVAFLSDGVRIALSGSVTFYPSQKVLSDMGYDQGWRIDKHPRFVADANGDGRPDLIGFGDAGVYVSTQIGATAFNTMDLWAMRYSASDAVLSDGSALPAMENVRGVADFDADGGADVFAFRADGLHATDLSIHIVQPAPSTPPRKAVGGIIAKPTLIAGAF